MGFSVFEKWLGLREGEGLGWREVSEVYWEIGDVYSRFSYEEFGVFLMAVLVKRAFDSIFYRKFDGIFEILFKSQFFYLACSDVLTDASFSFCAAQVGVYFLYIWKFRSISYLVFELGFIWIFIRFVGFASVNYLVLKEAFIFFIKYLIYPIVSFIFSVKYCEYNFNLNELMKQSLLYKDSYCMKDFRNGIIRTVFFDEIRKESSGVMIFVCIILGNLLVLFISEVIFQRFFWFLSYLSVGSLLIPYTFFMSFDMHGDDDFKCFLLNYVSVIFSVFLLAQVFII